MGTSSVVPRQHFNCWTPEGQTRDCPARSVSTPFLRHYPLPTRRYCRLPSGTSLAPRTIPVVRLRGLGSHHRHSAQIGPFSGRGAVASATFHSASLGAVGSGRDPVAGHDAGGIQSALPRRWRSPLRAVDCVPTGSPEDSYGGTMTYRSERRFICRIRASTGCNRTGWS